MVVPTFAVALASLALFPARARHKTTKLRAQSPAAASRRRAGPGKIDAQVKRKRRPQDHRTPSSPKESGGFPHHHGARGHLLESPANTAGGDYTVSAKFNRTEIPEPQRPSAPVWRLHRAATRWARRAENLLYCAAYGNGTFIVRGFGPAPFQMDGRRARPNAAVHKAPGLGQPVRRKSRCA